MSDVATAAFEIKDKFVDVAKTLFDENDVLVSFGISTERRDLMKIIAFLEVEETQENGPLSSTNRSRDADLDIHLVISVARAGDNDDREVSRLAYELLRTIEQYVRKTNPTLDGLCLWCSLTAHQSFGYTSAEKLARGRLCEIEATFTARVRITG